MNSITVVLLSMIYGCSQPTPTKTAMVNDIKLGMQIFEVRDIHNKDLTPIAFESRQGYDLAQYRGWFSDGTKVKIWPCPICREQDTYPLSPYKLTFELYPQITKIQCQYIVAKNNITDPNEVANLYSAVGLRPSRLIQVVLDEAELQRQTIHRASIQQTEAIDRNTGAMMREMEQIKFNQQMQWHQQQMQLNNRP